MPLDHLRPDVREIMVGTTEERIQAAQRTIWIGYPVAKDALVCLDYLLKRQRTNRMLGMLLAGASGNGKSTIIAKFRESHVPSVQEDGQALVPIVVMDMPAEPSETRFWSELLRALCIAHRETENVQLKQNRALAVLEAVKCRMLVIDEIHNILLGHARQQHQFLGVLKNLSNALRLPIVAVGTRDAIRALHTDPQLSSRFKPFGLPPWELNRDFLSVLATYETFLPLAEPSQLAGQALAIKLHNLSGGTIGGLARALEEATVEAIRSGREKIDVALLDRLDLTPLSEYGRRADKL